MRIALIVIDAFVALTAIGGGIALVTGLEAQRFSLEMLQRTPFSSYTVPGLLLAVVVGGSAALATVATLVGRAGGFFSLVAGIVLSGWIVGEVLVFKHPSRPDATEAIYFALGLAMVVLGTVDWWKS